MQELPQLVDVRDAAHEDVRSGRKPGGERAHRGGELSREVAHARHGRRRARADVVGAHQDRHVSRLLGHRGLRLALGVTHLRPCARVVVVVPEDARVQREEALVVAADPVEETAAGAPRLCRVVSVPAADVGRARDRVADAGDAARQRRRRRSPRRSGQDCGDEADKQELSDLHRKPPLAYGGRYPSRRASHTSALQ
jgi:hypothetical protein